MFIRLFRETFSCFLITNISKYYKCSAMEPRFGRAVCEKFIHSVFQQKSFDDFLLIGVEKVYIAVKLIVKVLGLQLYSQHFFPKASVKNF